MFPLLGQFVARRWPWVIAAWVVIVIAVRWIAPPWDSITRDGDLAFLPAHMPSVQGERLTREAFPAALAKSEFVVIAAREDRKLDAVDLRLADQLAARFFNRWGAYELETGRKLLTDPARSAEANAALTAADEVFDETI